MRAWAACCSPFHFPFVTIVLHVENQLAPALGSTGNLQEAGEHRGGMCSPKPLHRHPCTCGKPRRGVKAQRGDVQLGSPHYSNPDLTAFHISLLFLILNSQQVRATGLISLVFLILSLPEDSLETSQETSRYLLIPLPNCFRLPLSTPPKEGGKPWIYR